ncbi:hypothetical protein [Prosthecobacter sp.]|uniref:hypothetical protein n=1 Tax=Prosthecobacter sp. TaxID=1965333 RepID=UPI00248765D3|nr:hypothetical protein [Prosthecobacter sp.]MDI1314442.1 hypothetical protein [Prosthecobacter sp.]
MTLLERAIHRLFPRVGKAMRVLQTLMFRRAQWQSIKTGLPMDAQGHPIPWITYPALDYLSQLDFSRSNVLEYGGGQSSLWWAERAESVTTVEGETKWAETLRLRAPANLTVIGPVEATDYAQAPLGSEQTFHVIIIDGLMRFESAKASLPFLAPGGFLLLDNADWYPEVCAWLRAQGLVEIDFHGFGPVNDYTWCTSVFMRAHSILPHSGGKWPIDVYGCLKPEC